MQECSSCIRVFSSSLAFCQLDNFFTWFELIKLWLKACRKSSIRISAASLRIIVIVHSYILRVAKKGCLLCGHRLALDGAGRRAGSVQNCL